MDTSQKIKLNTETTEKINKIDGSIVYWSLQLSQAMMKVDEVKSQIGDLYEFKKTAVLEDLKSKNISIENCDIATLDSETVMISKRVTAEKPTEG
jgi:hypothetical protein